MGWSDFSSAIWRSNYPRQTRGQIIARFGQRGNAFPRFGETSTAADIAVDPLTNNILVLDTTGAVARLTPSGRYDTTFGSRSIVRTLAGVGATGSAGL